MNSRILCLVLLLLLACQSIWGQRYSKRKIRKDLQELPGFENAYIGFILVDPERSKPIFEQNAHKHMTPASTTKLFTVFGAMQHLPDTLPALEYIIKGDSLIFWSTGYPLTLHPDHPDSTVIQFLKASDKRLYYWVRPTKDSRFGPGWGWDDSPYYYGAEKSVFPVYGNSVRFILNNQNKTYSLQPYHQGFRVTTDSLNARRNRVVRDEWWNEFTIDFSDSDEPDTLLRSFHYNHALFTDLLAKEVGQPIERIALNKRPQYYQTLPGVPADSLYKWTLQPSDNLFAEQLLLMISGQMSDTLSTEKGIEAAVNSWKQQTNNPEDLVWVDGSGLSRYNMFKPSEFIALLSLFREQRILPLMAQGGTSGTLQSRYGPYVYAKTGTLRHNHCLAGYIRTDKGKLLYFALMVNHFTAPTGTIRSSMGTMLEKIKSGY